MLSFGSVAGWSPPCVVRTDRELVTGVGGVLLGLSTIPSFPWPLLGRMKSYFLQAARPLATAPVMTPMNSHPFRPRREGDAAAIRRGVEEECRAPSVRSPYALF